MQQPKRDLPEQKRQQLWSIFKQVRSQLINRNLVTYDSDLQEVYNTDRLPSNYVVIPVRVI